MCVIYRHTLLSITCPPTVTSNAGGTLSNHFRRFLRLLQLGTVYVVNLWASRSSYELFLLSVGRTAGLPAHSCSLPELFLLSVGRTAGLPARSGRVDRSSGRVRLADKCVSCWKATVGATTG